MGARGRVGWAGAPARAGVGVPLRACRGVGMGAVLSMRVYMLVFVWVRVCPGVRAYGCVCFLLFVVETLYFLMFLFFLLLSVSVSTTRATAQFTLITAHHDRIPS